MQSERLVKNRLRTLALWAALLVTLAGLLTYEFAWGQEEWTAPYRLSSGQGKASEASIVVDQTGLVHAFWPEERESDLRTVLQYARFDGETWSIPNDIRITRPFAPIDAVSATVDNEDNIHLVWTEGLNAFMIYSRAPAEGALSVANWTAPTFPRVSASELKIRVTADGTIHVLYSRIIGAEPGVYYMYSNDDAVTWSIPQWLDPDIPAGFVPTSVSFELDSQDGLHAVWSYKSFLSSEGDWVRYIRSEDGGLTWAKPVTIAKNDEGAAFLNAFARPIMTVVDQTVHVIWAGGTLLYRHHRISADAGKTWTETADIFGNLNGQAGDGFAVDGKGRVHYFGQIRFPQGIYHAYWEDDRWSEPTLIYLLRAESTDSFGDNIQAHRTFPAIRGGNQIILTFTDGPADPERRLFTMIHRLDDVQSTLITPTAAPTATPEPTLIPTLRPEPSPTPLPDWMQEQTDSSRNLDPASILWLGSVPTLLLVVGIIIYRMMARRGH